MGDGISKVPQSTVGMAPGKVLIPVATGFPACGLCDCDSGGGGVRFCISALPLSRCERGPEVLMFDCVLPLRSLSSLCTRCLGATHARGMLAGTRTRFTSEYFFVLPISSSRTILIFSTLESPAGRLNE